MHRFDITTASHPGGRQEQQDSAGHWSAPGTCLVVVADGVGGSTGGRAASQEVLRCAAEHWERCGGKMDNPELDLTEIARRANDAIHALAPGEKRSPASTLVALYLDQTRAHWVHSGDSRLYWMRPEKGNPPRELQRTRDHSVVQMLLEQGKITAGEMNTHPDKGRILKALGSSQFKGVDYACGEYAPGDTFLLCTDGYWESVAPGYSPLPPQPDGMDTGAYADQLVNEAVQINGPGDSDNTTLAIVTVVAVKGGAAAVAAAPSGEEPPPAKGQTLKMMLMALLYIFILFDIIIFIYLFILK